MKKFVFVVLAILCTIPLFAMSLKYESEEQYYDSYPMLDVFYKVENGINKSFWDSCKFEVITVAKDSPIYSWFGHCAIMFTAPGSKPIMYDWGTFAFGRGFFVNFALGRLWYSCSRTYGDMRIELMKETKRTISSVELDLTAEQKSAVYEFLESNATPGYNIYLYKYFTDNCATRVRDLLNYISEGDFEEWATAQEGKSLRSEAGRVLSCSPFYYWAVDFLEGPQTDKKATKWDDMFLPENLEKSLLEYGKLGTKHIYYADYRAENIRKATPETDDGNLVFSIVLSVVLSALALVGLRRKKSGLYKTEAFTVNLVFGLMGSILMFMMCFTVHEPVYLNENIAFINPVMLIIAVLTLTEKKPNASIALYRMLTYFCMILIAAKLALPEIFMQQNWCKIITLFPYLCIHSFVKKAKA